MPFASSRITVITSILIALAAIAPNGAKAADFSFIESVNEVFGVYPMQKGVFMSELDASHRPPPGPPFVATYPAQNIGDDRANLGITVDPNGASTMAWFRFGVVHPGACSNTFGTLAPDEGPFSPTGDTSLASVRNLTMGTNYYFCGIAENMHGMTLGGILSFTTLSHPPNVNTWNPSPPTATTALLTGALNPFGVPTTGWFRYSTTDPGSCNDTFGTRAPASGTLSVGSGHSSVEFNLEISGLTPLTDYYVCAIANNEFGTGFGLVAPFRTLAAPTPTDTPTSTPTTPPIPTATNTAASTPTATATASPTNTPTNTATNTPANTATNSPTSTAMATSTSTATYTPTPTFIVTTTANSGAGSLRQAVLDANASGSNDTISFAIPFATDPGCVPAIGVCTITLNDEIVITNNGSLTITGTGASSLTIDGGSGSNRIFTVSGVAFSLSGVKLTGGNGGSSVVGNGDAGAIFVSGGTTVLRGVNIIGNSTGPASNLVGGGVIFSLGSNHQLVDSTISSNTSAQDCGGFYNYQTSLIVTNTTISNNASGREGGGLCNGGDLILQNVTMSGNTAITGGGGVRQFGTFTIVDTMIAGNESSSGPPEIRFNSGTIISQGYNLVGDSVGDSSNTGANSISYQATDILDTPPMLDPLGNYGGTVPTMQLQPVSPAIDKGSLVAGITTDARNYVRPYDYSVITNAAGGNGSDIGAFERQPPSLGSYQNTTVNLSGNSTAMPSTPPVGATSITARTSSNYKGKLTVDLSTGNVNITNAHPSGSYPVDITTYGPGGETTHFASFILTVSNGVQCTNPTFAPAANFGVGNIPHSIAVGDLNGDGKQDLVTANKNSNSVSINLGDGVGGFGTTTNFSVGSGPYSVAVGDFNGDGKQDIVSGNFVSSNVSILIGDGSGGFGTATNFNLGTGPYSVAVGDFNSDGRQDIVTANYFSADMSILIGNGTGGFSAATNYGVQSNAYSVAIGDFNADGSQDAVVASYGSNAVSVLLGNGSGGFGTATNFGAGSGPASVSVGDVNGDSMQDIAVANSNSNNVSILIGNGSGGFGTASNFSVGAEPYSVALGDFNGDAKQDIATGNFSSNNVSVLVGNGVGSFGTASNFGVGTNPHSIAVGDFNADGKQDLTAANYNSGNNSVLLSNCVGPTPTNTATNTPTDTPTPTTTATYTPTDTPTSTPTPAETPSISGTITYGNAIGNPVPPRFVKNVSLSSTAGSPPVGPVITGTPGTYTLTGFGAGSYTIRPTKPGGSNGAITSNDAARVAQGVSSSVPFVTLNQKFASDASGNGTVSSNDAALIARFAAGLTGTGNVGQWKFFTANLPGLPTAPLPTPPYNDSRTYASVISNLTGEDYIALLIGEASGNYNPGTHPRPGARVESGEWRVESGLNADCGMRNAECKDTTVELPQMVTAADKVIVVPVSIDGATGKDIISYEFNLRYDPSVIQPLENPVDVAETASRGLMVVTNAIEPGVLRVVVYGPMPIENDGVLLNLRFTAVGKAGSVSPLTFERIMFNDGEPRISTSDGKIELF